MSEAKVCILLMDCICQHIWNQGCMCSGPSYISYQFILVSLGIFMFSNANSSMRNWAIVAAFCMWIYFIIGSLRINSTNILLKILCPLFFILLCTQLTVHLLCTFILCYALYCFYINVRLYHSLWAFLCFMEVVWSLLIIYSLQWHCVLLQH